MRHLEAAQLDGSMERLAEHMLQQHTGRLIRLRKQVGEDLRDEGVQQITTQVNRARCLECDLT